MLNFAVDMFLSLDIAQYDREVRAMTLAGNPDQARDDHGRWARIDDAMDEAKLHSEKALSTPQPATSHLKDMDAVHHGVQKQNMVTASTGTVEDHKKSAALAKSAANKFDELARAHIEAGNPVPARAAKRAAEDYRNMEIEHNKAVHAGGDTIPHREAKPAAEDSDTAKAFEVLGPGVHDREKWNTAYPHNAATDEAQIAREKSVAAREAQIHYDDAKPEEKDKYKAAAVDAHKAAITANQVILDKLSKGSGRRKGFAAQLRYHESQLRSLG